MTTRTDNGITATTNQVERQARKSNLLCNMGEADCCVVCIIPFSFENASYNISGQTHWGLCHAKFIKCILFADYKFLKTMYINNGF